MCKLPFADPEGDLAAAADPGRADCRPEGGRDGGLSTGSSSPRENLKNKF